MISIDIYTLAIPTCSCLRPFIFAEYTPGTLSLQVFCGHFFLTVQDSVLVSILRVLIYPQILCQRIFCVTLQITLEINLRLRNFLLSLDNSHIFFIIEQGGEKWHRLASQVHIRPFFGGRRWTLSNCQLINYHAGDLQPLKELVAYITLPKCFSFSFLPFLYLSHTFLFCLFPHLFLHLF